MDRVFTQTFGVVAALIVRDGKILLVKQAKRKGIDQGKWDQPGGWLEVGENLVEGAKRETREETGYDFFPTHVLGVYSLVRTNFEQTHHALKVVFLGDISQEPVSELQDDITEVAWFTPEEIKEMDSATLRDVDVKTMVDQYLAGQQFPLELLTHTVSS